MRIPALFLSSVVSLLSIASAQPVQPPATSPVRQELPAPIREFQQQIQAMVPEQVTAAAAARFGNPTRDIGSGLQIPQWDIAGGTLTVHPGTGPIFEFASGQVDWLMRTRNPARATLLHDFEMTTLPDPAHHNNTFWIGNLHIMQTTYRFIDSGSNLADRGDQSANFFISHPSGRLEIEWADGIADDTPLESAGDRTIAHVTFIAEKGDAKLSCAVESSASSRMLRITSKPFSMWAGWRNYFPVGKNHDQAR